MSNSFDDALNDFNDVGDETEVPDGSLLVLDGRVHYVRGDHDGDYLTSLTTAIREDWKLVLEEQKGDRRLAALSLLHTAVANAEEHSDNSHEIEKKDDVFHLSCRISMAIDILIDVFHVVTLKGGDFDGKVE